MSDKENKNTEDDKRENTGEGKGEHDEGSSPASKKKKIIIIAVIAILLIGGGGVGFFFYNKKHATHNEESGHESKEGKKEESKETEHKSDVITPEFIEMEEFLVNLDTKKSKASFLKMNISLEVMPGSAKEDVLKYMPVIRDNLEVYLHELRAEDLQGSAGLYRLKEELLLRINKIIYPLQIKSVLFKNMLVQ